MNERPVFKRKQETPSSSLLCLPASCRLLLLEVSQRAAPPPAVEGSGAIPTGITVFLTNHSLRQLSAISTVARASGQSHTLIKHNLVEQVKTRTNEAPLWRTPGSSRRELPPNQSRALRRNLDFLSAPPGSPLACNAVQPATPE